MTATVPVGRFPEGVAVHPAGTRVYVTNEGSNSAFASTAVARLTLQKFSDSTPIGDLIDATPPGGTDSGNTFRYDSTSNQYIFNLSTKPLSAGTWQLIVTLDDGTVHTDSIGLR